MRIVSKMSFVSRLLGGYISVTFVYLEISKCFLQNTCNNKGFKVIESWVTRALP